MPRMARTTKTDPLESWHTLQTHIHNLNEKELQALIERELQGLKRRALVLRLHMKLNKLRYRRERDEYTRKTKVRADAHA